MKNYQICEIESINEESIQLPDDAIIVGSEKKIKQTYGHNISRIIIRCIVPIDKPISDISAYDLDLKIQVDEIEYEDNEVKKACQHNDCNEIATIHIAKWLQSPSYYCANHVKDGYNINARIEKCIKESDEK